MLIAVLRRASSVRRATIAHYACGTMAAANSSCDHGTKRSPVSYLTPTHPFLFLRHGDLAGRCVRRDAKLLCVPDCSVGGDFGDADGIAAPGVFGRFRGWLKRKRTANPYGSRRA
jgi:hypothetical protein